MFQLIRHNIGSRIGDYEAGRTLTNEDDDLKAVERRTRKAWSGFHLKRRNLSSLVQIIMFMANKRKTYQMHKIFYYIHYLPSYFQPKPSCGNNRHLEVSKTTQWGWMTTGSHRLSNKVLMKEPRETTGRTSLVEDVSKHKPKWFEQVGRKTKDTESPKTWKDAKKMNKPQV